MMVSKRVRRVPHDIETPVVNSSAVKSFDSTDTYSSTESSEQKYAFKKPKLLSRMRKYSFVVILLTVTLFAVSFFSDHDMTLLMIEDNLMPLWIAPEPKKVDLSVVILTYNKHALLKKLMPSIINQKGVAFELILVDNGCLQQTKQVYDEVFSEDEDKVANIPHQYLTLCDNPGYAIGNNKGVELASKGSEWLMLLNDDMILNGESFIQNMVDLAAENSKVGGVVCKLLNEDGTEVIEAGSIVWQDGTAAGIGRGNMNPNAPELSYPKPVDYGSGACLLVRKEIFDKYEGFDEKHFPNYYEDTDFQLHIQHDLGMEVWLQPKSIAFHAEHGSFSSSKAAKLMRESSLVFQDLWKTTLQYNHLPNPSPLSEHDRMISFMKAADLRARNPNKANILWLEQMPPYKSNGSGFGRAFDNLSMVASLGHRVTVVLQEGLSSSNCNKDCIEEITDLGVELQDGNWEEYALEHIDFYDIVYVSRPSVFKTSYQKWQEIYMKHSFRLIYDSEALWYRRDEMLLSLINDKGIRFPGGMKELGITPDSDDEIVNLTINHAKQTELKMLKMADAVISVSKMETDIVLKTTSNHQSYTIGHIMTPNKSRITSKTFHERSGLLFLASFWDEMYYNGDAAWYFIKEIYPLVLKESKTDIPLTIAGKKIPSELRKIVSEDENLSKLVDFRESVPDVKALYSNARLFIAPHLYGAGIQYKVSVVHCKAISS